MNIQTGIMDIQNSIYGYPKIDLWLSKTRIMVSKNRVLYIDIQNYGYPKFELWIFINKTTIAFG